MGADLGRAKNLNIGIGRRLSRMRSAVTRTLRSFPVEIPVRRPLNSELRTPAGEGDPHASYTIYADKAIPTAARNAKCSKEAQPKCMAALRHLC